MRRGRPPYDDILTPREWQVLDLLAEGLTNEAIAERLGISFGAAKYHVAEILSKLGVNDRQAAVEAARRRRQRGLVALPLSPAWIAVAAVVVIIPLVLLGLIALDGSETRRVDSPPSVPAQPDEARTASPFANTLLLTKTTPTNVGDAGATVASLRTVRTLRELKAALEPHIVLIVVDQSAMEEIRGTDFVLRQTEAGRAFVGLNLCFAGPPTETFGVVPYGPQFAWETSPAGETRYIYDQQPPPDLGCVFPANLGPPPAYFSYRARTQLPPTPAPNQSGPFVIGGGSGMVPFRPGTNSLEYALSRLNSGAVDGIMSAPGICPMPLPDGRTVELRCP